MTMNLNELSVIALMIKIREIIIVDRKGRLDAKWTAILMLTLLTRT